MIVSVPDHCLFFYFLFSIRLLTVLDLYLIIGFSYANF